MTNYEISKLAQLVRNLINDGLVSENESDILNKALSDVQSLSSNNIDTQIDFSLSEYNLTCKNCGTQIPKNAMYCPICGGKLKRRALDIFRTEIYFYSHDGDDRCKYCIYQDGCPKGVTGTPTGPSYPPCADNDPEAYIDYDLLLADLDESGHIDPGSELVCRLKSIMEKYLYSFKDNYTLECIKNDIKAYILELVKRYNIQFKDVLYPKFIDIGSAPNEILNLLPYALPVKMTETYTIYRNNTPYCIISWSEKDQGSYSDSTISIGYNSNVNYI